MREHAMLRWRESRRTIIAEKKLVGEKRMDATPTSIRMLVIDIDGTLLNPEGHITARTRTAIQAAQQAGIIVTLATARRYHNTAQIATELELENPLILYDGALIVRHPASAILHRRPLNATLAQQAVDILVQYDIQPIVHPDLGLVEEIWTGPEALDNLWTAAYFTTYADQLRRMPPSTLCTGHANPLRVVCFASEEAIEAALPTISALPCTWTTIKRGNYGSSELVVMDVGCSKASGVAVLAEHFSLPMDQIMALGDNNNDREMLQSVGWGVAMGQAPAAVKAAANAVTASNAEDGAAIAIERYALRFAASSASNSRNRPTCF